MEKEKNKPTFVLPAPVLSVLENLCAAGYEAFLVGGCVRDFLRGIAPHDYDMATNARPQEMKEALSEYRLIETGIRHGTLTVLADGMAIELTTYRIDGDYHDSRHPESVCFTTKLQEDVARRDFTMNAIAYHPVLGLRDYFGGRTDIDACCIRAVGEPNRRFGEDALRILRAMRFAAVLGFTIEEETARAMHACAPLLVHISAERILEELGKLLGGHYAGAVLAAYADVLAPVMPTWYTSAKGDVVRVAALVSAAPADAVARFAAFLWPLRGDLAAVEEWLVSLRFDRRTRERVSKLLSHWEDPCMGDKAVLRRFIAGLGAEDARLLLALHRAEADVFSDSKKGAALLCAAAIVNELVEQGACCTVRDLAVRGDELAALGCPHGKEMGLALHALLEAVLDGRVANEKAALLTYWQTKET